MKAISIPKVKTLKPYKTKTYIYDKNGTLIYNCFPEKATRVWEHWVYPIKDRLFHVLIDYGMPYVNYYIIRFYHKIIPLFRLRIPYKIWKIWKWNFSYCKPK